ncbi:MAG: flagellar protein FlaG [Treponema sp.]|nr:flagellar protein FlaG [Treponema sp.]
MIVTSVGSGLVTPLDSSRDIREGTAQRVQVGVQQAEAVKQAPLPGEGDFKPQIINTAVTDLERISLVFNKKLQFVVDHSSNEVTVKVIDKETDKVIKELPPEELQRLHSNLRETIGFLFDKRV